MASDTENMEIRRVVIILPFLIKIRGDLKRMPIACKAGDGLFERL
jgi:hypothetical protein